MSFLYRVNTLPDPFGCDGEIATKRDGWAVVRTRPDAKHNTHTLWSDVLEAGGHDIVSSLRNRADANAKAMAFSWLAVEAVDHLVIATASYLNANELVELCSVSTALGIKTWLLYDVHVVKEREAALNGLGSIEVPLKQFIERYRKAAEPVPLALTGFPLVPDTHFLAFRHIAESVLSDEDFTVVADRFDWANHQIRNLTEARTDVNEEVIAQLLHELTSDVSNLQEIATVIAGAQVGLFVQGWHAQVDLLKWSKYGVVSGFQQALDQEGWDMINQLHRPQEAAACVLATLGLSTDDIPEVMAEQVSDNGASVIWNARTLSVPEPGRRALIAQLIQHGFTPVEDLPFLTARPRDPQPSERWATNLFQRIRRTTGVTLRSWQASRGATDKASIPWTSRRGVLIRKLAK